MIKTIIINGQMIALGLPFQNLKDFKAFIDPKMQIKNGIVRIENMQLTTFKVITFTNGAKMIVLLSK